MNKRQTVCDTIKTFKTFTAKDLYTKLRCKGVSIGLDETARYLYRLKQMGFVAIYRKYGVHNGNHGSPMHIWRVKDRDFILKGRCVTLSATVRAVAAANPQFFLRSFKKTLKNHTREDLSSILCYLTSRGELSKKNSLLKSVNLYFKK